MNLRGRLVGHGALGQIGNEWLNGSSRLTGSEDDGSEGSMGHGTGYEHVTGIGCSRTITLQEYTSVDECDLPIAPWIEQSVNL